MVDVAISDVIPDHPGDSPSGTSPTHPLNSRASRDLHRSASSWDSKRGAKTLSPISVGRWIFRAGFVSVFSDGSLSHGRPSLPQTFSEKASNYEFEVHHGNGLSLLGRAVYFGRVSRWKS
jgi:hypothetical protein